LVVWSCVGGWVINPPPPPPHRAQRCAQPTADSSTSSLSLLFYPSLSLFLSAIYLSLPPSLPPSIPEGEREGRGERKRGTGRRGGREQGGRDTEREGHREGGRKGGRKGGREVREGPEEREGTRGTQRGGREQGGRYRGMDRGRKGRIEGREQLSQSHGASAVLRLADASPWDSTVGNRLCQSFVLRLCLWIPRHCCRAHSTRKPKHPKPEARNPKEPQWGPTADPTP
jgi:hypothetical protein